MPLVTAYIPSWNHGAFLARAVRSVLEQTHRELELIVVENGSADNSRAVLRTFDDPRLRVVELPANIGACAAANLAISQARGEFVAPLGSDDAWHPEKLAAQLAVFAERPDLGAVLAPPRFVDAEGRAIDPPFAFSTENRSRHAWLAHFFHHRNALCLPSALLRRSVFAGTGLFAPALRQLPDLDFWVRLCLRFELHVLPQPLLDFRWRGEGGNISAPSEQNNARADLEFSHILRHYVTPHALAQAEDIFGAACAGALEIAARAMDLGPPHRQFASEMLLGLDFDGLTPEAQAARRERIETLLAKNRDPFGQIARRELKRLKQTRPA